MKFDNHKRLILAGLLVCMSFILAENVRGQGIDDDLMKALARPVTTKDATEEIPLSSDAYGKQQDSYSAMHACESRRH